MIGNTLRIRIQTDTPPLVVVVEATRRCLHRVVVMIRGHWK